MRTESSRGCDGENQIRLDPWNLPQLAPPGKVLGRLIAFPSGSPEALKTRDTNSTNGHETRITGRGLGQCGTIPNGDESSSYTALAQRRSAYAGQRHSGECRHLTESSQNAGGFSPATPWIPA
jgi:hypothetical protein